MQNVTGIKQTIKKNHPNPLNCNLCYNWSPLTIQLEAWGKEWKIKIGFL